MNLNLLTIYVENYLGLIFLQQFFSMLLNLIILDKFKSKFRLISYIAVAFILSILYYFIGLWINILNWITLIIFNQISKKRLNISLTISSLSILIFILSDHITTLYFDNISNNINVHVFVSIVIMIFFDIIISFLYNKVLKTIARINYVYWVSSVIFTFTFFVYYIVILIERYIVKSDVNQTINALFFIIYAITSIVILFISIYIIQRDLRAKNYILEIQYLEEYASKLEDNYNEMRKFKHDYQNILMSLDSYIQDEDILKLKEYFEMYIKPTANIMSSNYFKVSQLSRIEVKEVKSIMASKLLYSQELGIDTIFEANETIDHINLNSIKLIRSLGILLDNAIEEVKKNNNEGYIRVAFIKKDNSVMIILSNSCSNVPKLHEIQKYGFSTKGSNRGVGLSNLREMLIFEKNVTLETKIEENVFTQIIEIRN